MFIIKNHTHSLINQTNKVLVLLNQLEWLWSNALREKSATNAVTIINQQHCKVSRYNGSSIWKRKISSMKHCHKVLYTSYKYIIYKLKELPTRPRYSLATYKLINLIIKHVYLYKHTIQIHWGHCTISWFQHWFLSSSLQN